MAISFGPRLILRRIRQIMMAETKMVTEPVRERIVTRGTLRKIREKAKIKKDKR